MLRAPLPAHLLLVIAAADALPLLDTYDALFVAGSRCQPLLLFSVLTRLLSCPRLSSAWPVFLPADIDHLVNTAQLQPRHKLVAFLGSGAYFFASRPSVSMVTVTRGFRYRLVDKINSNRYLRHVYAYVQPRVKGSYGDTERNAFWTKLYTFGRFQEVSGQFVGPSIFSGGIRILHGEEEMSIEQFLASVFVPRHKYFAWDASSRLRTGCAGEAAHRGMWTAAQDVGEDVERTKPRWQRRRLSRRGTQIEA
ncbi:hypothetical protein B0H19DRAFT_1059984 [Mycena capillaripes]|nr:hypothetical protein B0H19DRAFT_1059984 [Mycena capillaripes]